MKTQVTIAFALLVGLCFAANLSAGQLQNGVDMGKQPAAPAVNVCYVSDSASGGAVVNVPESTPVTENLFWLNHESDGSFTTTVKFVVKFNANSPLVKQVQIFNNGGSIETPFGVPYWGGNPIHGPATLKVKTDTQKCTYLFNVTP